MKIFFVFVLLILPIFAVAGELIVTGTITGVPGDMFTAGQGFGAVYYDTNSFEVSTSTQIYADDEYLHEESNKFIISVKSNGIPESIKIKSVHVAINITSDFQLQGDMIKQFSITLPTMEVVKNNEKCYSIVSSSGYNSHNEYWCTRSDYTNMGQRWVGDLGKFY